MENLFLPQRGEVADLGHSSTSMGQEMGQESFGEFDWTWPDSFSSTSNIISISSSPTGTTFGDISLKKFNIKISL